MVRQRIVDLGLRRQLDRFTLGNYDGIIAENAIDWFLKK